MPADLDPLALARAAEAPNCAPTSTEQDTAVSRTTARHATDKDHLSRLLAMLALPHAEDDLAALLPLLPSPAPEADLPAPDPIGDIRMSVDAHLAVALSMYRSGSYTLEQIHEAADLDPAELAAHLAPEDHTDQGPAPATPRPVPAAPPAAAAVGFTTGTHGQHGTVSAAAAMYSNGRPLDEITAATGLTVDQVADAVAEHIDADTLIPATPVSTVVDVDVEPDSHEQLLAWAAQHSHPHIRDLALQARRALDELAALRGTEHDRAQVQSEVDRLRAALAEAEQRLHELQPTALAGDAPVPLAAVPAPRTAPGTRAPAGRIEQPADKRARQAIRTWANSHNYQVAPQGLISQTVLRAYTDAHQAALEKAS